jgi:hypothetical protein
MAAHAKAMYGGAVIEVWPFTLNQKTARMIASPRTGITTSRGRSFRRCRMAATSTIR